MATVKTDRKTQLKVEASVQNSVAQIRIVDYIGSYENSDVSVRETVDSMLAQKVTEAEVYINSGGGSVFVATEIANQLDRFDKVTITVGALAASAATYLTSKFYTKIAPNSQLMVHPPMMGVYGNVDEIESNLKMLKNLTQDYISVYAAKTGMSTEAVEVLWSKGDYWMNGTEAVEKKFADELISSDVEITTDDALLLEACAAPNIYKPKASAPVPPKNTNNSNPKIKMEKLQLIAALGLPADATDEQISTAVAQNRQKAEAYDSSKKAAETLRKLKAKQLVEAAVLAKQITAEEAVEYQTLAEADYDTTASLLTKKAPLQKPTAHAQVPSNGADPRATWTAEDYLEKDPDAFAQMETEDPAKFKALNAAYFGK